MSTENQNSRSATLEDLRALKAEYGVNSYRAFQHLKTKKQYRDLRDGVLQDLKKEGIRVEMPIGDIENICHYISRTCGAIITDFLYEKITRSGEDPYAYGIDEVLVDKREFILEYGRQRQRSQPRQALEDAVRFIVKNNIPVIKLDGKRKVSFAKAVDEYFSRGGWRSEEWTSDLDEDEKDFLPEHKTEMLKRIYYLDCWLNSDGVSPDYLCLLSPSTRPSPYDDVMLEVFSIQLKKPDSIELKDLYSRAKIEQTLNRIWIERRIALHSVIGRTPYEKILALEEVSDVSQRIDKKIRMLQMEIDGDTETLDYGESIFGMDQIRESVEAKRYQIRAIKKNRAWLERVLKS